LLNIDKILNDLPWLSGRQEQLQELLARDACPHALLIHGREGSGRRHLALWLAEALLGVDPLRPLGDGDDGERRDAGHPDLFILEPEEEGKQISVSQVRGLTKFLSLTSHGLAGRLAIVWPAERMTTSAANSLLKTLEEPPSGVVILLISESIARLPKTVVSRCQQVRIPAPPREQALEWLAEAAPGVDLQNLLDFSGGAPLAALALHDAQFVKTATSYADDLRQLEERQTSPIAVAARWQKEPDLALRWLDWRLNKRARLALTSLAEANSGEKAPESGDIVRVHATIQACNKQMGQIRELRRVINGGINAELNIAGLLMDWYGGFGT